MHRNLQLCDHHAIEGLSRKKTVNYMLSKLVTTVVFLIHAGMHQQAKTSFDMVKPTS